MATLQGLDEAVAKKWEIEPRNYAPWVEMDKVMEVLDIYREKAKIKSINQLAKIMGVKPQSIYQAKNRGGKMMAVVAIKWLDSLGVDPKVVLEPEFNPRGLDNIDPLTSLFLDIFPEPKTRSLMIKYQNEVRLLVESLEEKLKEKRAAKAEAARTAV